MSTSLFPFEHVISSEDELRAIVGYPAEATRNKARPALDAYSRAYLGRSPFLLIGTANETGRSDVSPRGDAPGFVSILDDSTFVIPERPGNRRTDTICNILRNEQVGVIFLIPTVEETLRVNGRARIVRDPELMASMSVRGKTPVLGIAVHIDEVFFHCAKAFRRSGLWKPEGWQDASDLPTLAEIIVGQRGMTGVTVEQVACDLEEAYQTTLY